MTNTVELVFRSWGDHLYGDYFLHYICKVSLVFWCFCFCFFWEIITFQLCITYLCEGCSWHSLITDKLHHPFHLSPWMGDPMKQTAVYGGCMWERGQAAVTLRERRMADPEIHLSKPEWPFPLAMQTEWLEGKISGVRLWSRAPEGIRFCGKGNWFCELLWSHDTVWSRGTHNLLRMGLLSVECLVCAIWYSPSPVFHLQNNYRRNWVIPNGLRFKEIYLPKITKLLSARILNLSRFLGLVSFFF